MSTIYEDAERRVTHGEVDKLPEKEFTERLHELDTMSEAIAMSSPSGRQSKRAKAAASERLGETLFGPGGLKAPQAPDLTAVEEAGYLRQRAKEFRRLAAAGMRPRAHLKEAVKLETEADELEAEAEKINRRTGGRTMTTAQVIADEETARIDFEARTVAAQVDGHDVTIAELRKVFDAVCDSENWKAPWAAFVPAQAVSLVTVAIEFFHADRPIVVGMEPMPSTGRVLMEGKGYQG